MSFTLRAIDDQDNVIGANLLGPGFEFPRLVLKRSALEHNLAIMAEFCQAHGVFLAPHAKTTMAPKLLHRQVDSGAWGMTVASLQQLQVCARSGITRVLVANEIVNPHAAEWLGHELEARGGELEAYCLVDSAAGVAGLSAGLRSSGLSRPLPVLVELGLPGGRAGTRSIEEGVAVARAVAASPELELAGVEGFEGILGATRSPEILDKVDTFLGQMNALAHRIDDEGLFRQAGEVILSAGGSTFFDRAAIVLGSAELRSPTRIVLRSGCYITHEHSSYGGPSPLAGEAGQPAFIPALELWSDVLSTPEPGRAIAGYGRRDAPFDAGLPVVLARVPAGTASFPMPVTASVTGVNDQHAYIDTTSAPEVEVGDRLVCGIRHPCTAFDKWRTVLMVDDGYEVVDVVETFF